MSILLAYNEQVSWTLGKLASFTVIKEDLLIQVRTRVPGLMIRIRDTFFGRRYIKIFVIVCLCIGSPGPVEI